MATRSTFLGPRVVTGSDRRSSLPDWTGGRGSPGNSPRSWTVPETDTGGLVEHTQVFERTALKELGKLPA
jgi:hypothetical protein